MLGLAAVDLARQVREQHVRPTEVIAVALEALDRAAPLNAVVARDDTAAMAAAAQGAETTPRTAGAGRPLAGVPVTVKDWIDVVGLPCRGATANVPDRAPTRDATAVARLRRAGAVVVAKTLAGPCHPLFGCCCHPDDPARSPGGSSSGEAALLGAGASVLGLGSDSGGSIRLPAAWCGVVGLKPSFGLVPDTGHFPRVGPHADGRTVIGPLARWVVDVAAALPILAGPDQVDWGCVPVSLGDPATVPAPGLRVAVVEDEAAWRPARSTAAAVRRALDVLLALGAVIVDEAFPARLAESLDITTRYWHRRQLTGVEADRQLRDWDRFARRLTQASAGVDLLVAPVVTDVAPPARELGAEDYVFTMPWSLTGWPALSLPAGRDPATGLPLAVQLVAPRWHDHVVLAAAAWLEAPLAGPG